LTEAIRVWEKREGEFIDERTTFAKTFPPDWLDPLFGFDPVDLLFPSCGGMEDAEAGEQKDLGMGEGRDG
jgi:hypothetical protein